jgi:hypothetical protein
VRNAQSQKENKERVKGCGHVGIHCRKSLSPSPYNSNLEKKSFLLFNKRRRRRRRQGGKTRGGKASAVTQQ